MKNRILQYGVAAAIVIAMMAVLFAACGSSNNGLFYYNPKPADVKFTTTSQVATSVNNADNAGANLGFGFFAHVITGLDIETTYGPPMPVYYSMNRRAKNAENMDPKLKSFLDNVAAKTSALKTFQTFSVIQTISCSSGTVNVDYKDNSDNSSRTSTDSSWTFTFDNCDTGSEVINGVFSGNSTTAMDGTNYTYSSKMNNLVMSSASETIVMNTTFTDAGSVKTTSTSTIDSYTSTLKGTIVITSSTGTVYNYKATGLKETGSNTYDSAGEHDNWTDSGTVEFIITDNTGTVTYKFTNAVYGMNFKDDYLTGASGTHNSWTNGSLSYVGDAGIASDCQNGTLNISTPTGSPVTYTSAGGSDAVSGMMKINHATIEFAKPAYPNVTVTLSSGVTGTFADYSTFLATGDDSCFIVD